MKSKNALYEDDEEKCIDDLFEPFLKARITQAVVFAASKKSKH
jgi:hypothetical protein